MADSERNTGRELVGLIIILIGFGLLMSTLNILPGFPFFSLFHRFWLPGMFIAIGVLILSRRGPNDGLFPGMFFILFGSIFLLNRMDWGFNFSRLIAPAILIWIGLAFLTRNARNPGSWRYRMEDRHQRMEARAQRAEEHANRMHERFQSFGQQQHTDSSDFINATAILGAFNRKCPSQQFRGGDLTAIMGGGKIDLREARIQANEAVLDIFTLMGGIDIQVPADWIVEPRFTPILGGYSDRRTPGTQGTQRLVIHGTAVMGAVTVSS